MSEKSAGAVSTTMIRVCFESALVRLRPSVISSRNVASAGTPVAQAWRVLFSLQALCVTL